jgi:hypothetical protein
MKQYNRTAKAWILALTVLLGGLCSSSEAQQRAPTLHHPQASNDNECSNASLQSSYGFRQTGTDFAQNPLGAVGIAVFDGKGNLSGSGTFVNKTLGVNPDCTGFQEINAVDRDFVIVDGGNELFAIGRRSDRVATWEFKKQFPQAEDGQDN